jgi:hypothetical protein
MLCLVCLLRRRWLEEEHLSCPLVALPVDISRPDGAFFRNKVFWIGFALAATVEVWNSFSYWYPVIPKIPITEYNILDKLQTRPWNAMGWIYRSFFPFLIGIGYLMPSDLLFSCRFFYLFWKAELVVSAAFGLDRIQDFPFAEAQRLGAYLLFAGYGFWPGRRYFAEVWQVVRELPSPLRDDTEPLPYRLALLGIVLGLAALIWFEVAMGMSILPPLVIFAVYYILGISVTRMRAQFGSPIHDLHFSEPATTLVKVFGMGAFSIPDRVGMAISTRFTAICRSRPMPHQMEGVYVQDRTGGTNRGVAAALALAGLLGAIATFWAFLHIYYNLGEGAKALYFNKWVLTKVDTWVVSNDGPQWGVAPAIGVGLVVALFLQTMRMRYVNWPFHPLGFAIPRNIQMEHAFMSPLVAWTTKSAVTRRWGDRACTQATPSFPGFILADFAVISVVNIVSIRLGIGCYQFVD